MSLALAAAPTNFVGCIPDTSLTCARRRYNTPLVADIHFQPKVALLVADAFEKIRINPGNFSDGRKTFEEMTYDDPKAFVAERDYIREVCLRVELADSHAV